MVWDILGPILAVAFVTVAGGSIKMLINYNERQQERHDKAIEGLWQHVNTADQQMQGRLTMIETTVNIRIPQILKGQDEIKEMLRDHIDDHNR